MKTTSQTTWGGVLLASLCTLAIAPAAHAGTQKTVYMSYGGMIRSYVIYVPALYTGNASVPLVVDLHPLFGTGSSQASNSGYRAKADTAGFIVVFPNGYQRSWNAGDCCGESYWHDLDDVGFIKAVVAKVNATYKVDCNRVYAAGYSNGAELAQRLAVDAADTFAAVASVAGDLRVPYVNPRPMPVMMVRGYADTLVPYDGGLVSVDFWPRPKRSVYRNSADYNLTAWTQANNCSGPAVGVVNDASNDVAVAYQNCAANVEVLLFSLNSDHFNYFDRANTSSNSMADVGWAFMSRFVQPTGGTCGKR